MAVPLLPSSVTWTDLFALLVTLCWTFYLLKAKPQLHSQALPGPDLAFLIRNSIRLGLQPPEVVFQRWAAKFGSRFPSFFLVTDLLLKGRRCYVSASPGKVHRYFEQPRSFPQSYG